MAYNWDKTADDDENDDEDNYSFNDLFTEQRKYFLRVSILNFYCHKLYHGWLI